MNWWINVTFGILTVFCVFAIYQLFKEGKKPYAKAAISTYGVFAVLFLVIGIFKVNIPPYTLILGMLTIFGACFLGHYLGGYTKSRTFDRYLHAFGSFSFSLLIYFFMEHFITTGGSLLFRAIVVFLMGNTLGVFFELIEMYHDVKKKKEPKSQKGLRDTDMDMLFNLMGAFLAGVGFYVWLGR